MDKLKVFILIVFLLVSSVITNGGSSSGNSELDLKLNDQNKLKIDITQPVKKMDAQVFKSRDEMMKEYFQVQKKMDLEDIKALWEATVDRNPIIKFALKKLAAPAEQGKVHSSIMAKSVSTLISGAAILPGVLGADPITSAATSASGTIANRIISSKEKKKEFPLTDTELIHLARLVEDLQDRVIKNYYQYKSDLESLKIAQQKVFEHNKAYSVSIDSNNQMSVMTAKILYDNALKEEILVKQRVKLNRLELSRLVGDETLNNLKLGRVIDLENNDDIKNYQDFITNNNSPPIPKPVYRKVAGIKKDVKNYGDKSVKDLSYEIGAELKDEQEGMLSDLRILWNSTVERSETIRFAMLKLSNPDGKVEKTKSVKSILQPLTGVASMVGMGSGNPAAVMSTMFGGGLLNSVMSSDNNELNSRLSMVTDADLVLLAQETDNLQQKLVNLYCNYTDALIELNFVNKSTDTRKYYFKNSAQESVDFKSIANLFYQEGLNEQYRARQKVLSARVALEQFAGNDALISIDKNVKQRLSMQ